MVITIPKGIAEILDISVVLFSRLSEKIPKIGNDPFHGIPFNNGLVLQPQAPPFKHVHYGKAVPQCIDHIED